MMKVQDKAVFLLTALCVSMHVPAICWGFGVTTTSSSSSSTCISTTCNTRGRGADIHMNIDDGRYSLVVQFSKLKSTSNDDDYELTDTDIDIDTDIDTATDRRSFFQTMSTATAMMTALGQIDAATASVSSVVTSSSSLAASVASTSSLATASASTLPSASASASAAAIDLPPIGLGAWAWGDAVFWGYNPKQDDDLQDVFDYAVSKNVAFFDTAELYGLGRSETLLGNFRRDATRAAATTATATAAVKSGNENVDNDNDNDNGNVKNVQIATKFAALPFRTKSKDVVKACKDSLKRLNPNPNGNSNGKSSTGTGTDPIPIPIDLYQIHFPNAWSNENYWDGLAQCYEEGLVKAVGVSNYGVDALRAVHAKLAERGIPLATNQIQLSLLYRFPIDNGLLDVCHELGVKVLSYSPLALGFLTGKYDKVTRPTGPRANIAKQLYDGDGDNKNGERVTRLLNVMKEVSANHGNVPLSQVAINWNRSKGTIPIPGARSLKQAKQNIDALNWELTSDEVSALDDASAQTPAYISPDKSPFPKEDINTHLKMFDS